MFINQDCLLIGDFEVCREAHGNSFLCTGGCKRICGPEICMNINGGSVCIIKYKLNFLKLEIVLSCFS